MSKPRPFHRLFGLMWMDFFDGANVTVESEIDLSLQRQLLDLVIIHTTPHEPIPRTLPDGFEQLAAHNLITFKSFRDVLDAWALKELIGHYFNNYRKQRSPSKDNLLPVTDFRLFAVCARHPDGLERQPVALRRLRAGVYDVDALSQTIRVIVVNDLREEERNAMLHLFSNREELVLYGREHHRRYSGNTTTLLTQLFSAYREEPDMSEKFQQLMRETLDELLQSLSTEERPKGLPVEELRNALPVEERLKGLPAEERLKGLPAEERLKGLSPEEQMKALSPETLKLLAKQIKSNGTTPISE